MAFADLVYRFGARVPGGGFGGEGRASRCPPGPPLAARGGRGAMGSRLHAARPGRPPTRGGLRGAPQHGSVYVCGLFAIPVQRGDSPS